MSQETLPNNVPKVDVDEVHTAPEELARTTVIIADDESMIRMSLRAMLIHLGYAVIGEVGDGRSAVHVARELRPDVVIMDIKMPIMDGIEAARVLTEERVAAVLLLTAYSQPDLVERAKAAGVMGYILKPFQQSDLIPAIEVALARYRALRGLERRVEDLEEALATREVLDRAKGMLMDAEGLTESEAFHRIQQMSMDAGRLMREVAQDIIRAHEARR